MSPLKFYIAGNDLNSCRVIAANLGLKGYTVISRWLDEPMVATKGLTLPRYYEEDIRSCDVVITSSGGFTVSGGKFLGLAAAIGQRKPVIAIGEADNMHVHHPLVFYVASFQEAMNLVGSESFLSKLKPTNQKDLYE